MDLFLLSHPTDPMPSAVVGSWFRFFKQNYRDFDNLFN